MKRVAVLVAVVVVLGAGWFLGSPLFLNESVDEGFEDLLAEGRLDMDKVRSMSSDTRAAMRAEIMAASAGEAPKSVSEDMPASPTALKTGTFRDADAVHRGSGTATLYALPSGGHAVRLQEFEVTNGPDLVVYLAKHPSPQQASDVTDGGFLSLGKLKGNIGNQNYAVPSDVDVDEYGSVVIWCELFGVLFSPAALAET